MTENKTRAISGVVYITLLVLATLKPFTSHLLFSFFLLIATYEFCNLIYLEKIFAILFSIGFSLLFYFFEPIKKIEIAALIITLLSGIFLMFYLFSKREIPLKKFTKYLLLHGYVIFPLLLITQIPAINSYKLISILDVFIIIWVNDTFAYLIGKKFGKKKLFESISPKKTIEGFFGGLLFAMIAGIVISFATNKFHWILGIIFAIIISVFGTIGDLIESKFKRNANVKDSGKIMPGHGGILDRLDSIIFVTPFLLLFLHLIKLIENYFLYATFS